MCGQSAQHGYKKYLSEGFEILRCGSCKHVFTHIKEDISIEDLYEDDRYKVIDNRGSLFDKILEIEYNRVLGEVKNFVKEPVSLLDFGCGKGKFMSLAAKKGWSVSGVETSQPRATFATEIYGLDVDTDYYTSGKLKKAPFKVITLFHVVEHLQAPKELVSNLVKENLVEGGLLIIEVPNIDSWQSKWAGKDWLQLDVPRHVNHFTRQSIQSLISSLGFETAKISYFSFHVGLLGMVNTCIGKLGYKGDLIFTLKNTRDLKLYVLIAFILPFAAALELLSSFFGKGGIIRIYATKDRGK